MARLFYCCRLQIVCTCDAAGDRWPGFPAAVVCKLCVLVTLQEIDGQAFLLLSLPTVQEYLEYKLGPAVKLCHHIERLKFAFFQQYT